MDTKEQKFRLLAILSDALDKSHTDRSLGRVVSGSLVRLGSKRVVRVACIPTGLPTVDYDMLQYGGIPRGRIVEIFGPEGSGKTTTALHVIAEEQAQGGIAAYVDAEHKLEPTYAQALGVNLDDLLLNQPSSGEEGLDTVDKLVESASVSLIVVDSAAALVPEAELAGEIGDAHVGLQARMMSQAMRILTGKCYQTHTTIIFINQVREKIGVMFGNPEVTPCGRALKFFSSLRISITRPSASTTGALWEGTKDNIIGHQIDMRCVKNGGGIPFRRTQVNLIYPGNGRKAGFDKVDDTINFANKRSMFDVRGSWYWMDLGTLKPSGPERVANGIEKFKEYLYSTPKAMEIVKKQIEALVKKEQEGQ
jgi:recombination protein RecA